MNKNVGLIYDHFLKFTNEFSEPTKRVFIQISDVVEKFQELGLVSIEFNKGTTNSLNIDLTKPVKDASVLAKIKSLLEHTVSSAAMNACLTVRVKDVDYAIIVESGKYTQYPKEVAKIIKSIDVSAYLYLYYSLKADTTTKDDIISVIDKLFFRNEKLEMVPSQAIAHYFDLAVGNTVSSANSSKEAQSIANKQIEFEQLSAEIDKHRAELSKVIVNSKVKKETLLQSKAAANTTFISSSQLQDLRADAAVLKTGIEDTNKKLTKIAQLLPSIADELANGDLEKETRLKLADVQRRTEANKKTYEKMLSDNTIALENIASRIKVLESEQISRDVKTEPESKVTKEIFELDGKANAISDIIQDLSNRLTIIRKEISLFHEKDDNMKYVSKVNFADTLDFLNENYNMSAEHNLVYNFITFYYKSKLTTSTKESTTALSLFLSMFGFN